jgi:hypothetical protein
VRAGENNVNEDIEPVLVWTDNVFNMDGTFDYVIYLQGSRTSGHVDALAEPRMP